MTIAGFASDLTSERRRWLVEDAIAYVERTQEYRVTVAELCDVLDVGRRTLEYAFRDVLGASPKAYFVSRALEAAHHTLRAATPADRTVTDVATEFGFWHLGRFSATYRSVFGEAPSQTLRATA